MDIGVIMIDALTTLKAENDELKDYIKHLKTIIDDLRQANQDLKYQLIEKANEKMKKISNINEPNPFIGWEKNLTPVDTNPNSGLGGKALKKASEK
jgi:hypothetical protein